MDVRIFKLLLMQKTGEKWAPWCTIKTATKCDSYLNEAICANRYWNMRAEIQDTDSGKTLLLLSLRTNNIYLMIGQHRTAFCYYQA